MKIDRTKYGNLGLIISLIGVGFAAAAAFIGQPLPLSLGLLCLGSLCYLAGGLFTVGVHGYRRGSKPYLQLMMLRSSFALATMILVARLASQR